MKNSTHMHPGRFLKTVVILAGLSLGSDMQAGDEIAKTQEAPMTLPDLQNKGITQFIDKEFTLRAKVMWEYASVKIPEDPIPAEQLRNKASPITIAMDELGGKDGKRLKGIQASGADLVRKPDAQGQETYAFQKVSLTNHDKEYIMTVRLKLRPAFNKTHLENPAFVKQCNNPAYWSQTFEVEIVALREAP